LAIYPATAGSGGDGLLLLGGVATAVLGVGLALGWAVVVPWALGGLACEFVASLYLRDATLDPTAAVYGSALLLTAELAYWSFELATPSRDEGGLRRRRALAIAALVVGSLCVGLLAVAVAAVPVAGGLALTAAGIGAAVVAFVLVVVTAGRIRP